MTDKTIGEIELGQTSVKTTGLLEAKVGEERVKVSSGKVVGVMEAVVKTGGVQEAVITEVGVTAAVKQEKGEGVEVVEWKRNDFTQRGDNYVAEVTSIEVSYCTPGTETNSTAASDSASPTTYHRTSYVVKLRRGNNDFESMAFSREREFYMGVAPLLDIELVNHGLAPLSRPACFHATPNQLFLKDLRHCGFTMADRRTGLSVVQARLVVKELARLHAASHLVLSMPHLAPCLARLASPFHALSPVITQIFATLINGGLSTASELAQAVGREDMKEWFQDVAPRVVSQFDTLTAPAPLYEVIGHGDCWVNNLLFREDESGAPVEVALLDYQLCFRTTLAYDLNYLLYTGMAHEDRAQHLPSLLGTYHASFTSVMEAAGKETPFTLANLTEEFHSKKLIGVIYGALAVHTMFCDSTNASEFTVASSDEAQGYVIRKRESTLKMVHTNPLMRLRLASLYRDVTSYVRHTMGVSDEECVLREGENI